MEFLGVDRMQWAFVAVGLGIAAIIYVRRIKTHGPPRYAPATPRQKAITLALLVGMLGTWAVYFAGRRPFDGYEKQVALMVTMVTVFYVSRLTAILERGSDSFPPIADMPATVDNPPMRYGRDVLEAAHCHSSRHRVEVESSTVCGCFHCLETFSPADISAWLSEGSGTALCPRCDIDSVMGSASGYPVADPEFLRAMHKQWFSAS